MTMGGKKVMTRGRRRKKEIWKKRVALMSVGD
jgi:hypothetical protein